MAIKANPLKRDQIKDNITALEGEMKALNNELNMNPSDYFPTDALLPNMTSVDIFDYEKEIESIKTDSLETIECLSSLYLTSEYLAKKNISNIIKNDAEALTELKTSMLVAKRGLIKLMKDIDAGISDPELYKAVGVIQKEIRESVKMLYDTQKRIKDFYKDIRNELSTLITEEQSQTDNGIQDAVVEDVNNVDDVFIIDFTKLNSDIEEYMEKNKK